MRKLGSSTGPRSTSQKTSSLDHPPMDVKPTNFQDLPDIAISICLSRLSLREAVQAESVCLRLHTIGRTFSPRLSLDFGIPSFDNWQRNRPTGRWLAGRWRSFPHLRSIVFVEGMQIADRHMLRGLKALTGLTELNVSRVMPDLGAAAVVQALCGSNTPGGKGGAKGLVSLSLQDTNDCVATGLGNAELEAIAVNLSRLTRLRFCTDNPLALTNQGFGKLVASPGASANLVRLTLTSCPCCRKSFVDAETFKLIGKHLAGLRSLELRGVGPKEDNEVDGWNEGLIHLSRLPRLEAIAMNDTGLNDKGLGRICAALTALTELDLSYGGRCLTDGGLQRLGELPLLARLGLKGMASSGGGYSGGPQEDGNVGPTITELGLGGIIHRAFLAQSNPGTSHAVFQSPTAAADTATILAAKTVEHVARISSPIPSVSNIQFHLRHLEVTDSDCFMDKERGGPGAGLLFLMNAGVLVTISS